MAYGLAPTADNLLNQPFGGMSPFAPAGITDATRQGWATQLQGLANQGNVANQYAGRIGNFDPNSAILGAQGGNPYAQLGGQINQVGGSFNPMNPMLMGMIGQANQQLGRDFNQSVMPQMNRQFGKSGPGAYGGTRAGVAQGIREQGLADAMQRQTTQMAGQGYEAGLGRYVQDRGNTLGAMGTAQGVGAQNARTALDAQQFAASLAGQGAGYGTQIGQTLAGIGGQQQQQNQALQDWYNQQYDYAQGYPNQQFTNWTNWMSPIVGPGNQAPPSQNNVAPSGPSYTSPFAGIAGGAYAGATVGQGLSDYMGKRTGSPAPVNPGRPTYTQPGGMDMFSGRGIIPGMG